jgi:hypothetical protein
VLRLRAATRKGRCATRRRSRDLARVMRMSSLSRYHGAPRPMRSRDQTLMGTEECRVVKKIIPRWRTVSKSSTAAPPPPSALPFAVAGTKSPKTRAERELRNVRADRTAMAGRVLRRRKLATSHRIHIVSLHTTTVPKISRSQAPRF